MADDGFKTPTVDWRWINGALVDETGKKLPPGIVNWPSSQADMGKRSYRQSKYPGAFTRTAVNDDGTPIAAGTNELLVGVLDSLIQLREEMAALNRKMQLLLELD